MARKNKFVLTLALLINLSMCQQLFSQITIGSGNKPNDFSLLEIDASEAKGGLRLPQLSTIERDSLTIATSLASHPLGFGLIIYNTTINQTEYWNGSKWVRLNESYINNGLTKSANSDTIQLGGSLNKTTTIGVGANSLNFNSPKGNVSISGAESSAATLNIDGNLRIASTPIVANATVLVKDNATGMIGTAAAVPTRFAFIQSTQEQALGTQGEKNSFNAGTPFQVMWTPSDIVSNNVVTFNDASDYFVINEDGLYELSGFINYAAYSTTPATYTTAIDAGRSGVNVSIQVDKNDGSGWVDFTASRYVFAGTSVNSTAVTIVIPSGVSVFSAGTKIRMVFKRPASNFGLPHGTTGNNGILLPGGIQFSKGMKISAL